MLAKNLVQMDADGRCIVTTDLNTVLSNETINIDLLSPCNHEEADTRMFLHVKHAVEEGHQKICIKTVDTDVVAIAISMFSQLNVEELWIEIGTGKNKRWLPVHEYVASNIGPVTSRAISLWFALTGCETVSSFPGRGKSTAWKIWNLNQEIIDVFLR